VIGRRVQKGGVVQPTPAEPPVRWLTPDELRAWTGLQRLQAQLGAELNRHLSAHSDLSLQDYGVLVVLSEQPAGRLRPYELGRQLGWEKSRVSRHVGRMEARGLVERRPCRTDQRGRYVAITEPGRAALEGAAPAHVAHVRRVFIDLLTPGQLATLAGIADTVVGALDLDCGPERAA
jgi:DNA-binding MarR family transcriptional regulator